MSDTQAAPTFWLRPNGPLKEVVPSTEKGVHGSTLTAEEALPLAAEYVDGCRALAESAVADERPRWREKLARAEIVVAQIRKAIEAARRDADTE